MESAWHRNLRRDRSRVRKAVKRTASKKVRSRALRLLENHHGSAVPQYLFRMTGGWFCPCTTKGTRNGKTREFCSACGKHYTRVKWWPDQLRRQRSSSRPTDDQRPKTPRQRTKPDKGKAALATEVLEPFGTAPKEAEDSQPAPKANNSKGASKGTSSVSTTPTPEEIQDKLTKTGLLQKMQEMQDAMEKAGVKDPALMESMKALQKEVGVFQPQNQISHKAVTQLLKAEKARDACKAQLASLDAQWLQWKEYMSKKFTEQGELYKEQRSQLVTRLQECKDKAATIKEGLRSAASLLAAEEVEPTIAEPGLFQPPSSFQNFNPVECVQVSDDDFGEMEVTEQKKARLAAEALAAQQSPTKKHKTGEDPDL